MVKTPAKPSVLVTDAERGSAVAVIRSLGRRGFQVVAASCQRGAAGCLSRHARHAVRYPSPARHPTAFVESLRVSAKRLAVDLIVPVTDEVILPLSAARAEFRGVSALALPPVEALQTTMDKHRTVQLAQQLGVPTPATLLAHGVDEAIGGAETLQWPIVLKPQASRVFRGGGVDAFQVAYAKDSDELARAMKRYEGRCGVLVQEHVTGEGQGVELLLYDGRPLAAFQHRRIRETPPTGGVSAVRRSMPLDPQLYNYAVDMLSALRWTGLAMVEFKVQENQAAFMEINGRIWGSLPLAVHCGMDFPAKLAELHLGPAPPPDAPVDHAYATGVEARNIVLELTWLAQVLAQRRRFRRTALPRWLEVFQAAAAILDPRRPDDIVSLTDPLPTLGVGCTLAGKVFHKAFSAMRGRKKPPW